MNTEKASIIDMRNGTDLTRDMDAQADDGDMSASDDDEESDFEDEESDFEDEESDFDSGADYVEHDHDNDHLPALPERLKLPTELELLVLYHADRWCDLWLTYRLVCKAWRDHIEELAQRKWLPRSYLHFPNGRDYALKLFMDSSWNFQRLEEDGTAVFRDTDCADEYLQRIARECKRVGCPDVVLGHYVFKIMIPGLSFDWATLTARVPWRNFVTRIFAEENAVNAEIKRGMRDQWRRASRMKRAVTRGEMDEMEVFKVLIYGFGNGVDDAHTTVYKRTWGVADPAEVERVKKLRFATSFDPIDSDDDAREEELRKTGEMSTRESALFLQEHYRRNGID